MAAKFKKPILLIQSVGPGKIGTIKPEVGRRFGKLVLHLMATAQVLNQIVEYVEVEVGGQVYRRFTPDELEVEMGIVADGGSSRYKAQNNVAGQQIDWPIWFREPWRKGIKAGRALGWATGDVANEEFVVKVKFLSTAAADVSLNATLEYDNPVDKNGNALPMGEIVKMFEEEIEVTGVNKTQPIPKDRGDLLCVTLHDPDVSRVHVVVGDVEVRDVLAQEAQSDLTGDDMTANTNVFHLAFDGDDDTDSAIVLAGRKNAYLKLELSDGTPRNIRALFTFIGPRNPS